MPAISFIDTRDRSVRLGSFKDGFVALSYVWGKPTGSEPLHSSHKRLPPSCVPVIEDAIEATKQLGYRYLWVDRYRVDQIDPDVKHSQVVQMDKIYSAAALTIISDGDDARLGLPGVSHPRTPHERLGIGEHSLEIVEPAELVLQKSPRASRGWTYQERFFSFHSVVFSQHQIYLECQKGTFTPESMPGASIEQQGSKGFNFMDWEALRSVQKNDKTLTAYRADGKTIVNRDVQKRKPPILRALEYHIYQYAMRDLTFEHDALNGILGSLSARWRGTWCVTSTLTCRNGMENLLNLFRPRTWKNRPITIQWAHSCACMSIASL